MSSFNMEESMVFAPPWTNDVNLDEYSAQIAANPLLSIFGIEVFSSGEVHPSQLPELIEHLREAFEDGTMSDNILVEALKFDHFVLLKLMFSYFEKYSQQTSASTIIRCLAYAGNIYESLWQEFIDYEGSFVHVDWILQMAFRLIKRVHQLCLQPIKPPTRRSYYGYDQRDIQDYGSEGYIEEDKEWQEFQQKKEQKMQQIQTKLLVLHQFFGLKKISLISEMIQQQEKEEMTETEAQNNNNNITINPFPTIDELIQYETFQGKIKERLIQLVQFAIQLTQFNFEDLQSGILKFIIALAFQFPTTTLSLHTLTHPTIPHLFLTYHEYLLSIGQVSTLLQDVLYSLNDLAYPNFPQQSDELCSLLQFLLQILQLDYNHRHPNEEIMIREESCFGVNDLKVLMDICQRELMNITSSSANALLTFIRWKYLQIIELLITTTTWLREVGESG
jgi:hypothetical protein